MPSYGVESFHLSSLEWLLDVNVDALILPLQKGVSETETGQDKHLG